MKYLYFTFILSIFMGYGCSKKIQPVQSSTHTINVTQSLNDDLLFPESWVGKWCGELMIYDSVGLSNTLPMALEVTPTDSSSIYNWSIIYGKDSLAQVRAYQLVELNKETGHFMVDEKNGIFLDAYMRNNELTSIFEVMGNSLIICYEMTENHILFTVKFFPSKEIRTSGGEKMGDQDIPPVKSYNLKSTQIARLYKKCLVE